MGKRIDTSKPFKVEAHATITTLTKELVFLTIGETSQPFNRDPMFLEHEPLSVGQRVKIIMEAKPGTFSITIAD